MTHSPPRGRRDPCNEAHRRFVLRILLLQELRRVLLCTAANLANHDDTIRLFIFQEDFEAVDEVCAGEWVAADADDKGLAEAGLGGLIDSFVGEGAGAGDDADAATFMDDAGHDADFALALTSMSMIAAEKVDRICILER